MSYDLYFWKQTGSCDLSSKEIVEAFVESRDVLGVETFPTARFLERVKAKFPAVVENHFVGGMQMILDDPQLGCFLIHPHRQYLCVESHEAAAEVLNALVDIAAGLQCPLFDPQTGCRYTGD